MIASLAVLSGYAAAAPVQPSQPFETLPVPGDASPIIKRLGGEQSAAWLDEDVLTFVTRAEKGPVSISGGIQTDLPPIPGTGLWVGRFRRKGWDKAFVSYFFIGPEPSGPMRIQVWRGPKAPPPPPRAENVQTQTIEISSVHLGESRKVTVYLPKGARGPLPAFVLADGQGAAAFAMVLQALIDAGKVRPSAILGIHSGGYRGDLTKPFDMDLDYRASEYLPSGKRFKQHLDFVADELLPEAARRFGISTLRSDLCVAGFSNGGVFAAASAMSRPDVFGAAIPMSVGVPPAKPSPYPSPPLLFFAAGELEPGFLRGTRQTQAIAKAWKARTELKVYAAGHDSEMWQKAFAEFAPRVFPPAGTGARPSIQPSQRKPLPGPFHRPIPAPT